MLRVEQSVRPELRNRLLAQAGDIADGIRGINANDREAQSIDRVPLYLHLHKDSHACLKGLTCLGFEIRREQFLCA